MKKIFWIFLLFIAIGFVLGTDTNASLDKWKIDGVYQLKVNDKYFSNYLIFLPNDKWVYIHTADDSLFRVNGGKYVKCFGKVIIFHKKSVNSNILFFKNYTLPPQIEIIVKPSKSEGKEKTFYFLKQDINFEELICKLAN